MTHFVSLEDEDGEQLVPVFEISAIQNLFPALNDTNSPCLRFIDAQNDTRFNRLQIPLLEQELVHVLNQGKRNSDEKSEIAQIVALCAKALVKKRAYLCFYSDHE